MTDIIIIGAMVLGIVGYVLYLKKKKDKTKELYKTHSNSEVLVDKSGVTLLPSSGRYLTFERIVQIYHAVEVCTELKATGLKILYASFKKRGLNPEGWALYMSSVTTIMINTDKTLSRTAEDELLRHEMVHYLLSQNGMNEESRAHESSYFGCGPGLSLHNGNVLSP